MKVILKTDVEKLGKRNDIVQVKNGYAQNFLIPTQRAVVASERALNQAKIAREAEEYNLNVEREKATRLAGEIDGKFVRVELLMGKNGKSYGSVTAMNVSDAIKQQFNLDVDKKKIVLPEDINDAGMHDCKIKFFADIVASITVNVASAAAEVEQENA